MNGFPPPTGARHAPSHPVVFRATNSVVRYPDRSSRDDPPLCARCRRSGPRRERGVARAIGWDSPFSFARFAIRVGVLDPSESPPAPMLAFVGETDRGRSGAVRRLRAAGTRPAASMPSSLQRYLRLRSFGLADWRTCLRVGTDAAWATDRGEPIVQAMLAHLRANSVLLPAAAVLERIGLAARARARKKTFETLAAGLSDAERDTLTGLLAVDPELRRSRFAWLRDYSESPAPSNIVALLDRLEYARGLGIDTARAGRIHAARLAGLVDEGAIMSVPSYRRSRTGTADGDPRRPGREPRNPAGRRDARHVREIHGHLVQPGAEPG